MTCPAGQSVGGNGVLQAFSVTDIGKRRQLNQDYVFAQETPLGNLANLYAIISYETPFSEMLTSFFYVLAFSGVLYVFWTILRILFYGIRSLFLKKRNAA